MAQWVAAPVFYLLLRNMKHEDAIALVQEVVKEIANYEGKLPEIQQSNVGIIWSIIWLELAGSCKILPNCEKLDD